MNARIQAFAPECGNPWRCGVAGAPDPGVANLDRRLKVVDLDSLTCRQTGYKRWWISGAESRNFSRRSELGSGKIDALFVFNNISRNVALNADHSFIA